MSTALVEWSSPGGGRLPPQVGGNAASVIPLVLSEARRRPVFMAACFAAIALTALLIGLALGKTYTSTTTISVDDGTSPTASAKSAAKVQARAAAAREIALSHKVMDEILRTGGWADQNPDALTRDKLVKRIATQLDIASPRQLPNLIRVSYTDTNPLRAYRVTRRFGELIIQESLAERARESREAFEFADSQAQIYARRLKDSETRLAAYRKANPDARVGTAEDVNLRIAELRRTVDTARLESIDARAQEASVRSQFGGQSPFGVSQARSSQIQMQMADLRSQRDQLLLKYTPQYPDVVAIDHQMRDLQAELSREASHPTTSLAVSRSATGTAGVNPIYGELKTRLADARSRSAAAASRASAGQALLDKEIARSEQILDSSGPLPEMVREYENNRDQYQALLKRRAEAQVAMNLDAGQHTVGFEVQEPAAIPLQPSSSLRLAHVASAGLLLAVVAPMLLMVGWLRVDPRVRTPGQIEQLAGLPVLGSIPLQRTPRLRTQARRHRNIAALLVMTVPLAYGLVLLIKWMTPS